MVSVKCNYINYPTKLGDDYFIYTDVEVMGHADTLNMNHTTGIKLCAGISACCNGIVKLINSLKFNVEVRKGYFRVWTDRKKDIRHCLDKTSVYALNTLVCQLYELYCDYPSYFKTFDLVDVKEKL